MLVVAPWLTVRPALKPGSEKWRSVLPRDQKVSFAAGGSFVQKTQRNRVRQAAHAPVSWAQGESFQPFPLHLRGRRVCERVCVYTPGTHAAPALPGCGPDGAARAPRFVGGGGWRRSRTGGRSSGGRAAARCLDRSTRSQCFRLDGGPPTFAVRRDDAPARRVPAAVPLPAPSLSSLRLSARRVPHSSDAPALWLPRLRVCVLAVTSLFLVTLRMCHWPHLAFLSVHTQALGKDLERCKQEAENELAVNGDRAGRKTMKGTPEPCQVPGAPHLPSFGYRCRRRRRRYPRPPLGKMPRAEQSVDLQTRLSVTRSPNPVCCLEKC